MLHSVGVSSGFVGEYTQADGVQVGAAVGAAHATFAARARTTPQERHDLRRGALQGAARVTVPPSLGRKVWLEPISEGF